MRAGTGMILYLHSKPATRTGGWFHRVFTPSGDTDNAVDAMSSIVVGTTTIVFLVALCLCVCALWKKNNGAAFAGASVLLVLAVTLLHAAGSMLRLFTDSVVRFVPSNQARPVHISPGSAIDNVLLPKPDDLSKEVVARVANALKIDLIPVFFIAMLTLFAIVFWVELRRQHKRNRSQNPSETTKQASRTHELVVSLPQQMASPVAVAIIATAVIWVVMYLGFSTADPWQIADLLVTLQVFSAIAIVLIIIRRPEQFAERLRRVFGSVADIAGSGRPTCTHSPAPHIVAHCCPGSDRRSTTWFWNIRTLRSRSSGTVRGRWCAPGSFEAATGQNNRRKGRPIAARSRRACTGGPPTRARTESRCSPVAHRCPRCTGRSFPVTSTTCSSTRRGASPTRAPGVAITGGRLTRSDQRCRPDGTPTTSTLPSVWRRKRSGTASTVEMTAFALAFLGSLHRRSQTTGAGIGGHEDVLIRHNVLPPGPIR